MGGHSQTEMYALLSRMMSHSQILQVQPSEGPAEKPQIPQHNV